MPFSPSSEPALPAAWTDALERIQRVLAEALHAADARAQALEKSVVEESSRARSVSEGIPSLAHASGSAHQYDGLATEIEESLASAQEALSSRARSVSEGIPSLAYASGSADQCDALKTQIEESLASAQEALDRWLARAAETAQRLADVATRAV